MAWDDLKLAKREFDRLIRPAPSARRGRCWASPIFSSICPLRHPLSYAVPDGLALAPGQRVSAPVQGRARVGLVLSAARRRRVGPGGHSERAGAGAGALAGHARARPLGGGGKPVGARLHPGRAHCRPAPRRGSGGERGAAARARAGGRPMPPELWTDIAARRPADRAGRAGRRARAGGRARHRVRGALGRAARRRAPRQRGPRRGAPRGLVRREAGPAARGRGHALGAPRSRCRSPATLALARRAGHRPQAARRPAPALARHPRRAGPARRQPSRPPGRRPLRRDVARRRSPASASDTAAPERLQAAWPEIISADTRGILRNHPLTLPLTRAHRGGGAGAARAWPWSSRATPPRWAATSAARCFAAPIAAWPLAPAARDAALGCRLCGRREPAPGACPRCGGHRLSPFGWSPERVRPRCASASLGSPRARERARHRRRRPLGTRAGARRRPGRAARARARLALSAVGFVALDGLLRVPDFRAGERAFQSLWAARGGGGPQRPRDRSDAASRPLRDRGGPHPPARDLLRAGAQLPRRAGLPALPPALPPRRARPQRRGGRPSRCSTECRPRCAASPVSASTPPTPRGTPAARRPWWRMLVKGPDDLPRLAR